MHLRHHICCVWGARWYLSKRAQNPESKKIQAVRTRSCECCTDEALIEDWSKTPVGSAEVIFGVETSIHPQALVRSYMPID